MFFFNCFFNRSKAFSTMSQSFSINSSNRPEAFSIASSTGPQISNSFFNSPKMVPTFFNEPKVFPTASQKTKSAFGCFSNEPKAFSILKKTKIFQQVSQPNQSCFNICSRDPKLFQSFFNRPKVVSTAFSKGPNCLTHV